MAVILALLVGGGALGAEFQAHDAHRRMASMSVEEPQTSASIVLADPRIIDSVAREDPGHMGTGFYLVRRIDGFQFRIAAAEVSLERAAAEIEIESPKGASGRWSTSLKRLRPGDDLLIPARFRVTRDREGPYTATLRVKDRDGSQLYSARYGFGYPRYETTRGLKRLSLGALLRDDFESPTLDERIWRRWESHPERLRTEQRDGRYWIQITGQAGYNGIVSRTEIESRDLVLACRIGIVSTEGAHHRVLMHLCGSGKWSPDNWIEVQLLDVGGSAARAVFHASLPPRYDDGASRTPLPLPHPAGEGYAVKITCDGFTHRCRAGIQVDGGWRQIGEVFEVPARKTQIELKVQGWQNEEKSSLSWFDDCRIYPRPESHYFTIALRGADNLPPGTHVPGHWASVAFDARNERFTYSDLIVRLLDIDGKTVIDETRVDGGMDYALLKLSSAPWGIYPVPAVIRVFVRGEQLGPDHIIQSGGVEGLYPDDVYALTLE